MSGKYHPEPTKHRHKVPAGRTEESLRVDRDAVSMLLDIFGYPRDPQPYVPPAFKFTVLA